MATTSAPRSVHAAKAAHRERSGGGANSRSASVKRPSTLRAAMVTASTTNMTSSAANTVSGFFPSICSSICATMVLMLPWETSRSTDTFAMFPSTA